MGPAGVSREVEPANQWSASPVHLPTSESRSKNAEGPEGERSGGDLESMRKVWLVTLFSTPAASAARLIAVLYTVP